MTSGFDPGGCFAKPVHEIDGPSSDRPTIEMEFICLSNTPANPASLGAPQGCAEPVAALLPCLKVRESRVASAEFVRAVEFNRPRQRLRLWGLILDRILALGDQSNALAAGISILQCRMSMWAQGTKKKKMRRASALQ